MAKILFYFFPSCKQCLLMNGSLNFNLLQFYNVFLFGLCILSFKNVAAFPKIMKIFYYATIFQKLVFLFTFIFTIYPELMFSNGMKYAATKFSSSILGIVYPASFNKNTVLSSFFCSAHVSHSKYPYVFESVSVPSILFQLSVLAPVLHVLMYFSAIISLDIWQCKFPNFVHI